MYEITLDYDDIDYKEVWDDVLARYEEERGVVRGFEIYESSPRHFHVRLHVTVASLSEQMEIAWRTECSKEYLERVKDIGYWTIRTTAKSDGTPSPRLKVMLTEG